MQFDALSGWHPPPGDLAPRLAEIRRCDVAVVGGGYTGLSAALTLAQAGASVAVVESRYCGYGASSRNGGHLTTTIAGDPWMLLNRYRRRASRLVPFSEAAVEWTEGLIGRLEIDCDYEDTGNVYAALTRGELRRAQGLTDRLRELGADVGFVDESRDSGIGLPPGFLGGVHERRGGVLNPGKLAAGLRERALAAGVAILEATSAQAIEPTGGRVRVATSGGALDAGSAIVATNAYSGELGIPARRAVAPLWVTMVETEPIPDSRLQELGWTSRAGLFTQHLILESYRLTARSTIAFGSRRVEAGRRPREREPRAAVADELVGAFRARFPALADLGGARAWGGWMALTTSMLPLVGEASPGIYYALGYNGHGLAQAPFLGSLVARRIMGEVPEHLDAVWQSRPVRGPVLLGAPPVLRTAWLADRLRDRAAGGARR